MIRVANAYGVSHTGNTTLRAVPVSGIQIGDLLVAVTSTFTSSAPAVSVLAPTDSAPASRDENNAEGGVNGVTPTTSDTGSGNSLDLVTKGATAAIVEYTNVLKAHGLLAYRVATRGTAESANFDFNLPADGNGFTRCYFATDATLPTATSVRILTIRHPAGTIIGGLWFNSSGKFIITNGADGAVATSTPTLVSSGSMMRIEINVIVQTTSAATIQVKVWSASPDAALTTTPDWDSGAQAVVTQTGAVAQARIFRFGHLNFANQPSATGYTYYDDVATANGDWIGPANTWNLRTQTVWSLTYRSVIGIADCVVANPITNVNLRIDKSTANDGAVLRIAGQSGPDSVADQFNQATVSGVNPTSPSITCAGGLRLYVVALTHEDALTSGVAVPPGYAMWKQDQDNVSSQLYVVGVKIAAAGTEAPVWTSPGSNNSMVIGAYRDLGDVYGSPPTIGGHGAI